MSIMAGLASSLGLAYFGGGVVNGLSNVEYVGLGLYVLACCYEECTNTRNPTNMLELIPRHSDDETLGLELSAAP